MSKLDDLIKELCPDGVEYKKTNSFCEIKTGKGITSKDSSENGEYPIISGGKTPMGYYDKYNREGNTVTISRVGANAGFVLFLEEKFYLNDKCFSVIPFEEYKNTIIPKYLYYFFKNIENQIVALQSEGGVPTINTQKVGNLEIPVPPLPVQEEIVRILDKFTMLTAELTARRKQYEYYRDSLLSPESISREFACKLGKVGNADRHSLLTRETKVEHKKLNEIAEIYDGTHQTPEYKDSGIPFISVENIDDIYSSKKFISTEAYNQYKIKPQLGDLFMTRIGSIGKCAVMNKEMDLAYYVSLALIRPNQQIINTRYLKHFIESTQGKKELSKRTLHHAVPIKVNKDDVGKIEIAFPTLEIQEKIVNVLDNFDSICTDLKIGLPAEIDARKKQYEYYRDLLLTFAERGNTIFTAQHSTAQHSTDEIKLLQYVFGYAIVRLGEIAKINRGVRVTRDMLDENGSIPVYQNSLAPLGYFEKSNRKGNTTFVISAGAAGQIGYSDIDFWSADDCFTFDEVNSAINKYIYYFLQTKQAFIDSRVRRGSIPRISREVFEKLEIQLPTLEEQERIVKILDRFDSLCNDISSGLPAEIEARQKQYEYYRDKLLMFKEK